VTKKNEKKARGWLLTPVILATHMQRSGRLRFKASLGK
jgi:hypothetical protein